MMCGLPNVFVVRWTYEKIDVLLIADKKIAVLGQDFFPIITFTTKNHSDEKSLQINFIDDCCASEFEFWFCIKQKKVVWLMIDDCPMSMGNGHWHQYIQIN